MLRRFLLGLLTLVGLGLIGLFTVGASIIDRRMNGLASIPMQPVSAHATELHRVLFVADLHADPLLWSKDLTERSSHGHVDIPRLIEGNDSLQVFSSPTKTPRGLNYIQNDDRSDMITMLSIVSRWPHRTWSSLLARSLYLAEKLKDAAARSKGRLVLVTSQASLDSFVASRAKFRTPIAGLLSVEGLHDLEGKLENVDSLYAAGFRMAGLTHFFDNEVGGSSAGVSKGGITPFGRDVLRRMEERHMIVDLAHTSTTLFNEALALATRPVIVSHTGVQATCPGPRNLSDDAVRKVGQNGGVIGIGYWVAAVCGLTPDTVAAAIRHGAAIAGVDHVGLGSDFDGATVTSFDTSRLVLITDALLRRGFSDDEVAQIMGGNVLRLLRENLPEH